MVLDGTVAFIFLCRSTYYMQISVFTVRGKGAEHTSVVFRPYV